MTTITVYKHDHAGREKLHYNGEILARGASWVQFEARYASPDRDLGYTVFRTNDRFVEWHYADRWYNIFEVHDRADDQIKGWYCNITRPAIIAADTIRANDLALDLWVDPAGVMLTLDEDEFAALDLDAETCTAALAALADVRILVVGRAAPFDKIRLS